MIDAHAKEALVAEFRGYLDNRAEVLDEEPSDIETDEVDLFSLFTELTAIKNEVKLEARQVKGALDQFRELTGMLEQTNQRLSRDLENAREEQAQSVWNSQHPLLLGIVDLRDRIEAGLESARAYRPGLLQRLGVRRQNFLHGLIEGMEITLRRVDELLVRNQVQAVAAVGQRLDPHTMHAAGVEYRADRSEGVVLSEVRKGFLRGEEILRLAEVIVNKEAV